MVISVPVSILHTRTLGKMSVFRTIESVHGAQVCLLFVSLFFWESLVMGIELMVLYFLGKCSITFAIVHCSGRVSCFLPGLALNHNPPS
jgi:hypothetical protein